MNFFWQTVTLATHSIHFVNIDISLSIVFKRRADLALRFCLLCTLTKIEMRFIYNLIIFHKKILSRF